MHFFPQIESYCQARFQEFETISPERREILLCIAEYITVNLHKNKKVQLVFVCTHNSRRSHYGQIWARVAADYFGIENIATYSGGTEATAFHPNAIAALERIGFQIQVKEQSDNPKYRVRFGDELETSCFSKTYDHEENPKSNFAAIMTCSDAEENCPFIPGVELRIGTTYEDPKAFDSTPQEAEQYDMRCAQIARELLFVFQEIRK